MGDSLTRLLFLSDYNTRVVVAGTLLFGAGAGLVGTFLLLRRRALLTDALAHATLPGIVLAFMLFAALEGGGKRLPILLVGAALSALVGMLAVVLIRRFSRLADDAALGIVLSVFFGLGMALLGMATRMETGHAAGLSSFIYGKTASMLLFDAVLIGVVALAVVLGCLLLYKEFTLLCFDSDYAAAQGWPVLLLDILLMFLVVTVTVIGLSAVGLILVVAMLVIPPSAARFWTHRLSRTLMISAAVGALSGGLGAGASALAQDLPAGAIIVLVAAALFGFSLLFGTERGLVKRAREAARLRRRIEEQHLLRAVYELLEGGKLGSAPNFPDYPLMFPPSTPKLGADPNFPGQEGVPISALLEARSWHPRQLRRAMRRATGRGLIAVLPGDACTLTTEGWNEARRVVRNHRLWELFLITHADIAPAQVDRDADRIEHVLDPDMIRKLEALLPAQTAGIPASAHELAGRGGAS
ncbi:metal ABC transporter permease [bacterium]|nr:metal ABC transporter permease [bacterium]